MLILNHGSLALTLWNLEHFRLNGSKPNQEKVDEALNWIVKRQKDPGRFGLGFAAPTEKDYVLAKLPTGENIHSRAGTAHLLGEEAFWALSKWRDPNKHSIQEGLTGMLGRASHFRAAFDRGHYCCTTCSLSLWRALIASKLPIGESFVKRGIKTMNLSHDNKSGWRGFQFGWTVYSLASLEHPLADRELQYAAGRIERAHRRLRKSNDPYGLRKLGYESALKRV